jgi:Outer membrane protein beta-barrel domain
MIDCPKIIVSMRSWRWIGLPLFLFLAPPSQGQQSQFDLGANYSFLRADPAGGAESFNSSGGSISVAWHAKPWLDAAADFSGYNFGGQPQGVSGHLLTYTIGPRVRFPHEWRHWTPFGQVLAGGARVGGTLSGQSAGENGFALMLGGGADFRINAHLAARVFDVEYLMTRFDRVTNTPGIQNDLRISAGVVLHFGHRSAPVRPLF